MEVENRVSVLIPSLSPDEKLLSLLDDLRTAGFQHIVVINDGSAAEYDEYFIKAKEEYGCTVLTHAVNQGKGRALKTAFNYLLSECSWCEAAVTVDSDGQHRIHDVRRVAEETLTHPDCLVMGCRDFSSKNEYIPARSRFGNVTTSRVLNWFCGIRLSDTQTGLRGFSPRAMRLFMKTKGERFEYEMNMILDAKDNGMDLLEVPIDTVYIEENKTSHFNPLKDSLRIYAVFAKFIVASISSFVVDIALYTLFLWLLMTVIQPAPAQEQAIVFATYAARVLSALFNFFVNKTSTFKSTASTGGTLLRYAALCVVQVTASAFATSGLFALLKWNATLLKLIVDTVLFLLSFRIQRGWVFRKK